MAKREIRINYDDLENSEISIKNYYDQLENLRDALKKVNDIVVENSKADSIEKLEKRYKKVKKNLDACIEESDALYDLINGYRVAMTNIIKSRGGMTKVGRNDVYWNLESVYNAFDDINNVQNCHSLYSASEVGLSEEEKQAMQRNYNKIYNKIWGEVFPTLRTEVSISRKKIKGYYDNEITEYENKDDEYKLKSEKIRFQYSSPFEILLQSGIDGLEVQWKVTKGAIMAVVDILKGLYSIGNVIYYSVSGGVAAIAYLTCPDTPEWANDALGESEEYFGNIAYALSHPVETIESMAQSTNDTYEKEGLTYMVSYAVTDLLLGKALSGAGKADEIADVAGAANKADDVADVAGVANKADDVAGITDEMDTLDEIADVAGDTKHYDDLDNLDDLDDYYDDIYDQYYKDQFNPVKDGAIADPSDMDDGLKAVPDLDNGGKKGGKIKKPKKTSTSKRTKKISRKPKKKYTEAIDELVKKMKEEKIPKDISYEELVAKYGDEYYVKELKAAYSKYTGKKDQLNGIDYKKIMEENGKPVKKGEHAHHIVYKKGLPGKVREIAEKAQDILRKYDIDPATDPHNLVSAPNKGHSIENIKEVYKGLAKAEKEALEYCKKKGYNAKKTKQVVKQWLYDELDRLGNIASKAGR